MEALLKAELGEYLWTICDAGDLSAVLEFLSLRISQDSFDPPLESMMRVAVRKDHVAIVQHCLSSGAKVTDDLLKLIVGIRPLKSFEAMLTAKAVDINHYIPWYGDMVTCTAIEDDVAFAKLCFAHGADPNRNLFEDYKTALAAIAETASVPMASLFLDAGAKLRDSGAIVAAAAAGKSDMVQFLLDRGADVNEVGIYNRMDKRYDEYVGSALHRVVREGHDGIIPMLLEQGADVGLRDAKGRTPLVLAEAKGNDKAVAILRCY